MEIGGWIGRLRLPMPYIKHKTLTWGICNMVIGKDLLVYDPIILL
jgi:hypothetical protein